ncbi:MAG: UDP-3-O-(3-hydroxymyristoyl)glucosamine N-acyltransferase [Prosthecobacter sp.]|uniref:UDP-3-O-(3-hydroxymyristoyl)glucosamine N-acyltransferase n=1 Tax=Prosthecobacter sp. TaxID=1965333 RepID=UPI003903D81E
MSVTVRELAAWVDGEVAGDPELAIDHARPLADAGPGDITFVEDDRHLHAWHESRASAAVVRPGVPVNGRPLIRVDDPLMAFASILKRMRGDHFTRGAITIHPTACVHPSAVLGDEATIGPFCVVGEGAVIGHRTTLHPGVVVGRNCRIGAESTLYAHVVLYDGCILGERVTIHANSVIGSDGFGYRPHEGKHVKVPQLGHVEIGDDVEIGAATTIDRGTFGATRIGTGTKIDNLVQIGHNVVIGKHCIIVACTAIAGSAMIGDYVVIAAQVGIAGHVTIGAQATLAARCGVTRDLAGGQTYLGFPAIPASEEKRRLASINRLPQLLARVKELESEKVGAAS